MAADSPAALRVAELRAALAAAEAEQAAEAGTAARAPAPPVTKAALPVMTSWAAPSHTVPDAAAAKKAKYMSLFVLCDLSHHDKCTIRNS